MRAAGIISMLFIVLALPLQAQPDPGAGRPGRRGQVPPPGPPGRPPLEFMAERLAEELDLTDAQRPKYDEIVAKYAELAGTEPEGNRQRMRELGQAYREAREAGDEERAAQIREQMREQASERGRVLREFFDEVRTVLEPAQVAKLDEVRSRTRRFGERGGAAFWRTVQTLPDELNLTPEQRAQFDKLLQEQRDILEDHLRAWRQMRAEKVEQMRAAEESGDEELAAKLREELLWSRPEGPDVDAFFEQLAKVLTEEQRAQLAEFRADMSNPRPVDAALDVREILRAARRLTLNDEQRQKLRDINHQAMSAERRGRLDDAAKADLAARTKAQILEMLNADQKAQFEQMLMRDGRPGRPPRGPGRGPEAGPGGPPGKGPPESGPAGRSGARRLGS
ncbi:MAG: Spy/CpxP family protein refolding chaperone [Planctomycetota bacterium]